MNGGEIPSKIQAIPRVVRNMEKEFTTIRKRIVELNPDLMKRAKKSKGADYFNLDGCCLNYILCFNENKILQIMLDYLTQNGFKVGTLVFDGLMVEKDEGLLSNEKDLNYHLRKMEASIIKKTDINIKLVVKEMDEFLELGNIGNYEVLEGGSTDVVYAQTFLKFFKGRVFRVKSTLYLYDEKNGLWVSGDEDIRKIVLRHRESCFPAWVEANNIFGPSPFNRIFDMMAMKNVVAMVENDELFFVSAIRYDTGFLLFKNGVLEMTTGKLLPFDPKYRFLKRINRDWVKPSQKIVSKVRQKLIENPFTDPVKQTHFLQFFARAIGGHFEDKVFGGFIGDTNSGKGTWTQAMLQTFGPYVAEFNGEEILSSGGIKSDVTREFSFLCDIFDCRVAFSNDMHVGRDEKGNIKKLAGNKLKKIAGGGDKFKFREVYGRPIHSINTSCMVFMVNDMPEIAPSDSAVVDRAHYTHMDRSSKVLVGGDEEIDSSQYFPADPNIKKWLTDSGVQNGLVELLLQNYRSTKPKKPDIVEVEVNQYVESCEVNDIKKWIDSSFGITTDNPEKHYAPTSDLYRLYSREIEISQVKFSRELTKAGFPDSRKRIDGKLVRVRFGILNFHSCSDVTG
eukprot:Lithocolla_globosa_v1_NODE_838_length_3203_cov_10.880241.p1 type:complete len:621 gc:universal NODE_838_length_3203_cov_10.880241:2483-621(-)